MSEGQSPDIEVDAPTRKSDRDRNGRHAPPVFSPAAVFLLGLAWENLFEPVGGTLRFRCKGCGREVKFNERQEHFADHKQASEAPLPRSGSPTTTSRRPKGDTHVATTQTEPKVSKTRIARDAAIAVLKKASKPLTMNEVLEKALADPKVKAAGVPRSTISAQINFELAESKSVLVRVDRGVYAHKDAATKKYDKPAAPAKKTAPKASSKKTTASSGSGRKVVAPRKQTTTSGTQVTPHPKPAGKPRKAAARRAAAAA